MHGIAAHINDFDPVFYIRALVAVAAADGIADEEVDYIESQAGMLGVDAGPLLAAPVSLRGLSSVASVITRRLAYRDCFVLASIDGPPNPSERRVLDELREALGLDATLAARIEDWMLRYSSVLAEGEALLASE